MKSNELKLIIPTQDDWDILEQIAAIEKTAFKEDALSVFNLSLIASLNSVLAISHKDKVIAEAILLQKNKSIGLIFGIAVSHDFRKNGVGSFLLNEIISHAKTLGLTSLVLTVNPENISAMHLYQNKFNFKIKSKKNSHPTKNEKRWVLEQQIMEVPNEKDTT